MAQQNAIVVLDLGSTNIRSMLYNHNKTLIYQNFKKVKTISNNVGEYEIDANEIYNDVFSLLKNLFDETKSMKFHTVALGISCHRASFVLWDKNTGEPVCNIISWQDSRCQKIVDTWNNSLTLKSYKSMCTLISFLTKSRRFSLSKYFKFDSIHTIIRLHWLLETYPKLAKLVKTGSILFGTIETWIIWKLTGGKKHITDVSSVCATAMYHLISKDWNYEVLHLFGIPTKILPKIVQTHGSILGTIDACVFGINLDIAACIADQQAASFGCGCKLKGDAKVTFGTGTFLDISTGDKPLPMLLNGFNPLIGWAQGNTYQYIFESLQHNTSKQILNFMEINQLEKPEMIDQMALNLCEYEKDSNTVLLNDIHISQEARNAFDKIIFGFYQLWMNLKKTLPKYKCSFLRANGGVSKSNYIMQTVSTLCDIEIRRMKCTESTAVGTMLLCCITLGINIDDYEYLIDRVFKPGSSEDRKKIYVRVTSSESNP